MAVTVLARRLAIAVRRALGLGPEGSGSSRPDEAVGTCIIGGRELPTIELHGYAIPLWLPLAGSWGRATCAGGWDH